MFKKRVHTSKIKVTNYTNLLMSQGGLLFFGLIFWVWVKADLISRGQNGIVM